MRIAFGLLVLVSTASAGEWMFRLKDAHVDLRRALADRDAEAAWEHVDRGTRQQAGRLAAHIRASVDGLPPEKLAALQAALGVDGAAALGQIEPRDLLVTPSFLEAHPHLLIGDPEDTKLKGYGTRMALPPAVVIHKKTPEEIVVPYRFTVEGHFGCQAMDYRAQLVIPELPEILGPLPPAPELAPKVFEARALEVFRRAQRALAEGDVDALWPLLDCDSQSQADHFADQAQDRANRKNAEGPTIPERLSIGEAELAELDGRKVWALAWTREDLAAFLAAGEPRVLDESGYDFKALLRPSAYRERGRPAPEPVIEFKAGDQVHQIPVRVNLRSGTLAVTLVLHPPYYMRLRK